MLRIKQGDKLYILELLLVAGVCVFNVLQKPELVSKLFLLTFFTLVMGLLLQLIEKPCLNKLHILAILVVVLSFFHVALQAQTWAFSYYKKLIMFSCTALIIPFVDSISITKKHVNWILGINICVAVLYPMVFFFFSDPGYLGKYLTFHHSNPNAAGMFLLHSMLYCYMALSYYTKRIARVFLVLLMALLAYFIYLTECRSCYIAVAFFAILVALEALSKRKIKISPGITFLISIFPLIAALVYLAIVDSSLLDKIFGFLNLGEGKDLESRVDQWSTALETFAQHPFFGDYYGISGGTGMSQKHNTHIDILASYGIAPFVMFIMLLYRGVRRIVPGATTKFSRAALFAFFAIIVQGTFEAALVSGGTGLYVMSFGFLLLAKFNENET